MPPQGLLIVAAYLPERWRVRFIDENIERAVHSGDATDELIATLDGDRRDRCRRLAPSRVRGDVGQLEELATLSCAVSRVYCESVRI